MWLKGGGNRLGVVTRFTLKTFPQTDVYVRILILPTPRLLRSHMYRAASSSSRATSSAR